MLDQEQLHQLHHGLHGDPFSVLGCHKISETNCVYRVFQPHASKVSLQISDQAKPLPMQNKAETGLFELELDECFQGVAHPTLLLEDNQGNRWSRIDPYSFSPLIEDFDLQLWGEGNHQRAYDLCGAHVKTIDGVKGVHFVVSAPAARRVSVVGDFCQWDGRVFPMRKFHDQGLWEIFIPGMDNGLIYKYEIKTHNEGYPFLKADPYAFMAEQRPKTASVVFSLEGFEWQDEEWIAQRAITNTNQPISVYELHMGSWKRDPADPERLLSYREIARDLVPYIKDLGFTHIELLPIAEHPYDPSWGYQQTGYFATTSRFGTPHDFMHMVNECHKAGIGVIIDWVPGHFAKDAHGLIRFDGTALYEHEDDRQGEHKDWGTKIFNYGRDEVRNFLVSNARFWMDIFHIDGIRVDAVASMLYLDYSREEGEWIPNKYGGRENLEAIELLRYVNSLLHLEFPGVLTFAEESTAWGGVSKPVEENGLGFDFKWNMGWMNDTLSYMEKDSIYRAYHHDQLTFSLVYAFSENFILPFSHDEVVHLKGSMVKKMPGDDWQKFANLRLLLGYMYAHPGKKLLFMGTEFAQWEEWAESKSLDWHLTEFDRHKGMVNTIRTLNKVYQENAPLYAVDHSWEGFEWIDLHDRDNSILSFARFNEDKSEHIVCIFNFTPNPHIGYRTGVPEKGTYQEVFNSDLKDYFGSDVKNEGPIHTQEGQYQGRDQFIEINLPPLGAVWFKK